MPTLTSNLAFNALLGGLQTAMIRHQGGSTAPNILMEFQSLALELGGIEAVAPALEPIDPLFDNPEEVSRDTLAESFFQAATLLRTITKESHPPVSYAVRDIQDYFSKHSIAAVPEIETADEKVHEKEQMVLDAFYLLFEEWPEPMGLVEWSEDGQTVKLLALNRVNRLLQGLSKDEVRGENAFRFFYTKDEPIIRKYIEEFIDKRSASISGVKVLRHSGGDVTVDINTAVIPNTRYAYFLMKDETEREVFEAVLRNAQQPLTLFKFDQIGDPIAILTSVGLSEMLGYEPHEIDGKTIFHITPKDLHSALETRLRHFNKTGIFEWREAKLLSKDGTPVLVDIYAKASDVISTSKFAVAFFNDAKGRIAAERDAAEAQKIEVITDTTSGIAHNVNNALTILLGGLELFNTERPDEECIRHMTDRILMLRNMLYGFRKLTDSQMQEVGIYLDSILHEQDIRLVPGGRRVEIKLNPTKDPWLVKGPRFEIWQIAFNFIKNAIEAMEGFEEQTLTINTEKIHLDSAPLQEIRARQAKHLQIDPNEFFPKAEPGPYMKLTIEDTGPGILPDVLPRMFQDFFSTKSTRDASRGRGLATSRSAVAERGGLITVHTQLGKGTRFDIYLPATGDESEVTIKPTRSPGIIPDEDLVSLGNEVILLAGDEAFRNQLERILNFYRYARIIMAGDRREVIEVARRRPYIITAVIMDGHITSQDLVNELFQINPELPILSYIGPTPQFHIIHPHLRFIEQSANMTAIARNLRKLIDKDDDS